MAIDELTKIFFCQIFESEIKDCFSFYNNVARFKIFVSTKTFFLFLILPFSSMILIIANSSLLVKDHLNCFILKKCLK